MVTPAMLKAIATNLIAAITAILSSGTASAQAPGPVRLTDFTQGVEFVKRMRFDVIDILVGTESVNHLFEPVPSMQLSDWEYYVSQPRHTIRLTVRGPRELQRLQVAIAAQPRDEIVLILEDRRKTVFRSMPEKLFQKHFKKRMSTSISLSPCDAITRIAYKHIYARFNSFVRESRQSGQTDQRITLDDVFHKLLRGEIAAYMAGLDKVRPTDDCIRTFEILHWLKGTATGGFDLSKYALNEGLRGLLRPVVDGLLDTRAEWSHSRIGVRIVGYTDAVAFDCKANRSERQLERSKTGIDDWSRRGPLVVRYDGCTGDVVNTSQPIYFDLAGRDQRTRYHEIREGDLIENNCALGAVRAYIGAVYLANALGDGTVDYAYATGGKARPDASPVPEVKDRKVNIEFVLKAARATPAR